MAKPFSIQSPEDIAKEYGGNKQRIAQAMQLGVVDPTAGVLAGMFIDRMRSAQMQEQAPQATVAQQVMGGAPTAPAPAPSGGLGTAPQAMPQPAPPMAPAQPPMGMADGGLATLPVPDAMFDEPTNGGFDDGYAGGGLVAFADGGGIDADALRRALRAQESSGDYGILNREGSGAMGAYQFMPATARALAKRLGVEYRPDLMQGAKGRSKEGVAYQERLMDEQMKDILRFSKGDPKLAAAYHFAGPNRAGWQDKTAKYQSDIMRRLGTDEDEAMVAERDLGTAVGRAMSAEDAMGLGQKLLSGMPREELDRAKKYALEELDPVNQEKERKADMWQALAEMGFRMAASNSPYVLQAIGEAATATIPGIQASKKERKAAKNEAVRTLMAAEDVDRKTAIAGVELGMDIYKSGLSQEQFKQKMAIDEAQLGLSAQQIAQQGAYQQGSLAVQMAGLEAGKTQLQQYANALYEQYKARNDQGKYTNREGKLVPYKVSDAELRARAYEEAAKALRAKSGDGGSDPLFEDTGGQPKDSNNPAYKYQQ